MTPLLVSMSAPAIAAAAYSYVEPNSTTDES